MPTPFGGCAHFSERYHKPIVVTAWLAKLVSLLEVIVKNLELLLLALPAVVMFGFTVYAMNVHNGSPRDHAITTAWIYGILAAGFFILVYLVKFATSTPLV